MKDNKDCPVSVARKLIGRKWTILILYQLLNRKIYAQVPPKVEYSLNQIGMELIPVLKGLGQWGDK